MEANSSRSAQGDGPAVASAGAVNWRSHVPLEARQRIVDKMEESLIGLGMYVHDGELKRVLARFEEITYNVATSLVDYLRQISLKMVSVEKKFQHTTPINPLIPNSGVVNQTSSDSGGGGPLEANSWRSAQGDGPTIGLTAVDDWRSQLHPEKRQRIINKMEESLMGLGIYVPYCKLRWAVARFEETTYNAATSQVDYLRQISLKMVSLEKKFKRTTPINPLIPNSGVVNQTSSDSGGGGPLEANSWRSVQRDGPTTGLTVVHDWSSPLHPETRHRIVNKMVELLLGLGIYVPDGELKRAVAQFEESTNNAATSQVDYLRQISLKMESLEKKFKRTTPINPLIPNSGVVNQTSSDSGGGGPLEANSWRSAQGDGPTSGLTVVHDWRSQLQPVTRQRIVNKMMENFMGLSMNIPDGELKRVVARFEEITYIVATSQEDYVRQISLKTVSMKEKFQHTSPINPLIPNSGVVNQTSSDAEYCERNAKRETVVDASSDEYSDEKVMDEKVMMETDGTRK